MKSTLKNYLSVTKKEWNGLVVMIVLILLTLAAPYVYRLFHKDKIINFNQFEADAAKLKVAGFEQEEKKTVSAHLFAFNPNHLPDTTWAKLGLTEHQIGTIKHYEANGGSFRTKADVQKMYSLSAEDYKRLAPYISLPDAESIKPAAIIEINKADSAQLVSLKGIGPAYAMRIIRYRDKLGGFHAKQQLKEVFGIDEEHYLLMDKQVKVNAALVKKLNINKATFEDMRRFPYLGYKQINAIIQYRNEHGDYETLDDLKEVAILDDATLKKIKPYLVVH
ncbi:ComEA family DNA-binding protein [Mucilaginibacter sp. KACC 22063]|uniref:ComEA family DNA-binding protein n=1 Tax=Mucilaginibacter sp. KACC 22063 TaxID=3025666 RepID=UPI0023651C5B|nr:ComEA family DNA-binding protein [Mucilaginibacter sp. KACC 22063]WDF54527.1 ComEA family DNA-binding protein [Mucilaginibacter sp. KACC 22063]